MLNKHRHITAYETRLLRRLCWVQGAFSLRMFNVLWMKLHGPVGDPSRSIESSDKQRRRSRSRWRDRPRAC